jgi:ubiquinone/menaquinone biosynthesis C-methylase UbiE
MISRKTLFTIYRWMKRVIAPTLRYSQEIYEDILETQVQENTEWLDVGCGHQILPEWRAAHEQELVRRCRRVVGLDVDSSSLIKHKSISVRVLGNINRMPFPDCSFNLVTANMVVEHLDAPATQFREVWRILKPGGLFIFHTPNARGYTTLAARLVPRSLKPRLAKLIDGRAEGDVFRTHYRANTTREITTLASRTGFEVVRLKMIVSSAQFIIIPPLAALELLWIRLLMTEMLKPARTNIVAILRKSL